MSRFNVKVGEYYYAPHRRSWGVWKKGQDSHNGTSINDEFIMDFSTKVQAAAFVRKANNWI